jgi:hypothetical protein
MGPLIRADNINRDPIKWRPLYIQTQTQVTFFPPKLAAYYDQHKWLFKITFLVLYLISHLW